jgi:hypothetical protein
MTPGMDAVNNEFCDAFMKESGIGNKGSVSQGQKSGYRSRPGLKKMAMGLIAGRRFEGFPWDSGNRYCQ